MPTTTSVVHAHFAILGVAQHESVYAALPAVPGAEHFDSKQQWVRLDSVADSVNNKLRVCMLPHISMVELLQLYKDVFEPIGGKRGLIWFTTLGEYCFGDVHVPLDLRASVYVPKEWAEELERMTDARVFLSSLEQKHSDLVLSNQNP